MLANINDCMTGVRSFRNLILVMQPFVHNTFSKFTFEDGGSIASNKLNVMRQQPGTGR